MLWRQQDLPDVATIPEFQEVILKENEAFKVEVPFWFKKNKTKKTSYISVSQI